MVVNRLVPSHSGSVELGLYFARFQEDDVASFAVDAIAAPVLGTIPEKNTRKSEIGDALLCMIV